MIQLDARMYRGDELNDERLIECARWQHLVYVRTLKCASEFFYRNFVENAGWQPIKYHSIDWDHDHVFSYIMHPLERRHKGLAERILQAGMAGSIDDPNFQQLIQHVPSLDLHSASMYITYGSRMWDIDWVPLEPLDLWTDCTGLDHAVTNPAADLTDRLLRDAGHGVIQWNEEFLHTSWAGMREAYAKIKAIWDQSDHVPWETVEYFRQDLLLYDRVIAGFNPGATTWHQTSWLRNK